MALSVLHLDRRPTSVPEARTFVQSAIAECGLDETKQADLIVAVSEACSNVVNHAEGAAGMRVEVEVTESFVEVRVVDRGRGFSLDDGPDMPDPSAQHGRGLALIDLLCDDARLDTDASGTRIVFGMLLDSQLTSH